MILIDSVYIKDTNYYPQVFLEKYKHVVRKKDVIFYYRQHILLLTIYSDDFDDSDEKTEMKKIKYVHLFLKETRIILQVYFLKENKKNVINFFKLGTLKFHPDI